VHRDADADFYLMRMWIQMRIQVTKMMRIQIHNTTANLKKLQIASFEGMASWQLTVGRPL
jgi:hypothetical protein